MFGVCLDVKMNDRKTKTEFTYINVKREKCIHAIFPKFSFSRKPAIGALSLKCLYADHRIRAFV